MTNAAPAQDGREKKKLTSKRFSDSEVVKRCVTKENPERRRRCARDSLDLTLSDLGASGSHISQWLVGEEGISRCTCIHVSLHEWMYG